MDHYEASDRTPASDVDEMIFGSEDYLVSDR